MRSRLATKLKKKSQKSIIFTIFGTIAILYVLVQYGLPFLVNTSVLLAGKNDDETQTTNKSGAEYVAAPQLDLLPNATSSAQISVSGTGASEFTVNLYLNDTLTDKKTVDKEGVFSFEDVTLSQGKNEIKLNLTSKDNKESDFSNHVVIYFLNKPPALIVDFPSEGESFSQDFNKAEVKGKTDPDVRITINQSWAIVDSNGNFSYSLPLKEGENEIKIIATDNAGNKTEEIRTVNYSP